MSDDHFKPDGSKSQFSRSWYSAVTTSFCPKDLLSGLIVFLVALPLCLGIALASGAPLFSGILSGIIGGIVVGFFSGSKTSVSGPAAGLTAIVAAQIGNLGFHSLRRVLDQRNPGEALTRRSDRYPSGRQRAFSIRTASCPRSSPPNRPIRSEPIPTGDHSWLHRFTGTGGNRLRCWPRRSIQHTHCRQRLPF